MPIKFLLLGGGGVLVFLEGGDGSANFIFMGRWGFFRINIRMPLVQKAVFLRPQSSHALKNPNTKARLPPSRKTSLCSSLKKSPRFSSA